MGEVPLVSQGEGCPSARGTEALQSCFYRPGLPSMTTGRRESWPAFLTTWRGASRLLWRRQPPRAPRASLPSRRKKRRKKRRKNRGGDITSIRLRRSLFFVAPATPAGTACGARPADPAAVCPAPPGCRARGAFVLSNQAAQDARALPSDELRPRRIEGASWSQIRCLHGRSVRRGCERVAQPETTARTAAPAAQSMLPCSLLPRIARNCSARGGA